eukprot:scaffold30868_cov66-Phaeocystis_antarctica.AAC.2
MGQMPTPSLASLPVERLAETWLQSRLSKSPSAGPVCVFQRSHPEARQTARRSCTRSATGEVRRCRETTVRCGAQRGP